MKYLITFILSLYCITAIADNNELNRLLSVRNKQIISYQALVDSVIPNKVVKTVLLNEKLMLIAALDDSIIFQTYNLLNSETDLNDSVKKVNQSLANLTFDNERMQERTQNDLKMLLILKIVVAFFLTVVLVLIYFLVNKKSRVADEINDEESETSNSRNYINSNSSATNAYQQLNSGYSFENGNGLNDQAQTLLQLKNDNERLAEQNANLQVKLDESKAKNESILRKINKLINDLAGVN